MRRSIYEIDLSCLDHKEEVQAFYQEYLQPLKSGDIASLERIYADDYMLVRPEGDTFGK